MTTEFTKEDIEQFKKDCEARGLKFVRICSDEWCIEQLKSLFEGEE